MVFRNKDNEILFTKFCDPTLKKGVTDLVSREAEFYPQAGGIEVKKRAPGRGALMERGSGQSGGTGILDTTGAGAGHFDFAARERAGGQGFLKMLHASP